MQKFKYPLYVLLVSGLILSLTGCGSLGQNSEQASAEGEAEVEEKDTGEFDPSSIPASSPLKKIELGMSDSDVRSALGAPDDSTWYPTGKQWIPFYYGPDTGREEWTYSNQGFVVFTRNRYNQSLKVINVVYDPSK